MDKPSLFKIIGGIYSYVTNKGEIWCAYGAHWVDEEKCCIFNGFVKCEHCIRKENPITAKKSLKK